MVFHRNGLLRKPLIIYPVLSQKIGDLSSTTIKQSCNPRSAIPAEILNTYTLLKLTSFSFIWRPTTIPTTRKLRDLQALRALLNSCPRNHSKREIHIRSLSTGQMMRYLRLPFSATPNKAAMMLRRGAAVPQEEVTTLAQTKWVTILPTNSDVWIFSKLTSPFPRTPTLKSSRL